MKPEYVTWRTARGFARWHLVDLPWRGTSAGIYTVCGKPAPHDAQVSGERRTKASDLCKTCQERDTRERMR